MAGDIKIPYEWTKEGHPMAKRKWRESERRGKYTLQTRYFLALCDIKTSQYTAISTDVKGVAWFEQSERSWNFCPDSVNMNIRAYDPEVDYEELTFEGEYLCPPT